ncbi:MAG: NAD(P)H-binding protein [Sphingomonadales bacterium]|jgi:uncharacterized protein YbjT (DUF2867 family)
MDRNTIKHKTIWIAGGTGLVGRQLILRLCAQGHHVVSLLRRPSGMGGSRLSEFEIDFEDLVRHGASSLPVLPKPDVVISTLGTTLKTAGSKEAFYRVDHDYVFAFAKAGKETNARQMITVSSVSANRNTSNFYLRVKGEVESHLGGLGFAHLDIIRPGLLLGQRTESRPGESFGATVLPLIAPLLPSRYRAIESNKVANAIAKIIQNERPEVGTTNIYHNTEILRLAAN